MTSNSLCLSEANNMSKWIDSDFAVQAPYKQIPEGRDTPSTKAHADVVFPKDFWEGCVIVFRVWD